MTVILVLITFAAFILLDYLMGREELPVVQLVPGTTRASDYIEGFHVPPNLAYHPGHSWLLRERPNVERVGVDQFAARLLGKIDAISLPKPGHWIRQGQKIFGFTHLGEKTEMLSPVEGEVVEVNEAVAKDPSLLSKDPYGEGWLLMVHSPDEESGRRNLLPRSLLRSWMYGAAEKLYALQPRLAGATLPDGGVPVLDPLRALPGVSWEKTTREFFLT